VTSTTALTQLVDSYLDLKWTVDPVEATAAGVASHDGRLGSFGEDDVRQYVAAFKSIGSYLEECPVDTLQDEVDRTALLGDLRHTVHLLEREQPHVRNPTFWVSHVLEGLYLLLVFTDRSKDVRCQAAANRIRALPACLTQARDTLRDCPQVFVHTARQMIRLGAPLINQVRRTLAPDGDERFDDDCAEARLAIEAFASFLDEASWTGDGEFAIGEEAFNFRLHYQLALRNTAPELWRYGVALVERVEHELAGMAREIEVGVDWYDLVARLRTDHPLPSDLVGAYADETRRALAFIGEQEIAPIPGGTLDVIETPTFLQPLIPFAAYQPPGMFAAEKRGWLYVTPPPATSGGGKASRDHAMAELPATALHEGYPGHHLQFLAAQAQPRTIRKIVRSPIALEGWALYCEEMMGEQGFFRTREERLFQRVALFWRACRVVLDVGLHTRGMCFDDAVGFLVDRARLDRSLAEAEVRRYCAEPVYQLSYAVGRREFLALRSAYRAARGSEYSLKDFHRAVLEFGALPVSLIRWGLELDE